MVGTISSSIATCKLFKNRDGLEDAVAVVVLLLSDPIVNGSEIVEAGDS